jgi:hypothetical protein
MGMVKCPEHGLTHIITCCVHIQDAIEAGAPERASLVQDTSMAVSLLCARCEQLVRAAERSTGQPRISFGEVLESPIAGYCYPHACEWFAATGQGDLSEALARMRGPDAP